MGAGTGCTDSAARAGGHQTHQTLSIDAYATPRRLKRSLVRAGVDGEADIAVGGGVVDGQRYERWSELEKHTYFDVQSVP